MSVTNVSVSNNIVVVQDSNTPSVIQVNTPGPRGVPGDVGPAGPTGSTDFESYTASFASSASFNEYTSSTNSRLDSLETWSGSAVSSFIALNANSGSVNEQLTLINQFTGSAQNSINNLTSKTGSYATTGSNNFIGNQVIAGSLTVSGSNIFNGSQDIIGSLTISGSEQCSLHVFSDTAGSGVSLRDNTTTDDDQVGIGALGNHLCFRAGGAPTGNMRLLDNGNLGVGNLNPPEKLTVEGNISASAFQGNGSKVQSSVSASFNTAVSFSENKIMKIVTGSSVSMSFDSAGAVVGMVVLNQVSASGLYHPTEFIRLSGEFDSTKMNYVYYHYIGNSEILMTISQQQ